MKLLLAISALYVAAVQAAPAIVWTQGEPQGVQHTSDAIHAKDLFASVRQTDSDLTSVVFLVGRDNNGSESLSRLASSGLLPNVHSKIEGAHSVHHHVNGLESASKMAKVIGEMGDKSVDVSLKEFNRKLAGETEGNKKRQRSMNGARVLVVSASSAQSEELDAAVMKAIEDESISSVVLTAVRSTEEVKHERKLAEVNRLAEMQSAAKESSRRRLEDQNQQYYQQNQYYANNANDLSGIYYVSITPNILCGVMFFMFFSAVTWVGLSCMGMIAGQDVYADKYPIIGREA